MKKGIGLVALVITIVVLVILTGTVVITTMNNNMFDNTQSAVNDYNKKVIIEDIQTKIQIEKLKKANQGIYTLTMEEIIPILQEHGTFDNNVLKLTTAKGIEIWLYEIMPIPLEEYATIKYENSILTIQTELTNNGYTLQYTIDAGTTWNTYSQAVTVTEESGIMVRLTNEQGQVVSNTIKVTTGGNEVIDNTRPTCTITADTTSVLEGGTVTYTITFSEAVSGLTKEEIILTGGGTKGELSPSTGSSATYTIQVTGAVVGNQKISIAEDVCEDSAGNKNTAQTSTNVIVNAKTLTSISVTKAPSKTTYIAGESFNSAGMEITATYNNGTKSVVTGYTISPSGALTTSHTSVTITYGGKTTTQAITVKPPSTTLADLITGATEYGYSVSGYTANGVSEWSVFYEDTTNGYVFLISTNNVGNTTLTNNGDVAKANASSVYKIFKLGASGYTLNSSYNNSLAVANLVNNYGAYASPTNSKITSYVVGAIGGPTIELFAAAYKAKVGTNLPIVTSTYGYTFNGTYYQSITNDGFYCNSDYSYWLASPSGYDYGYNGIRVMYVHNGNVTAYNWSSSQGLRPVVCLKSTCPAYMNGSTIIIGN